ncbi:TPA: hypothetical protein ACHFPY_002918, partial [Enterobacter hormaechei]
NTDDLFVGKTLLHGDVLMWLMKTLLTSGCTNQRGAGQRVCARGGVLLDAVSNEVLARFIVSPGEVVPAPPHPTQSGQQQIHWM